MAYVRGRAFGTTALSYQMTWRCRLGETETQFQFYNFPLSISQVRWRCWRKILTFHFLGWVKHRALTIKSDKSSGYDWFHTVLWPLTLFKTIDGMSQNMGLYSVSGRTSYRKISRSLGAARFRFKPFQSLWNLTHRRHRYRDACQIPERYDHYNIQSHGFETRRDLTVISFTA